MTRRKVQQNKIKEASMVYEPEELAELVDTVLLMEAWTKAVRQMIVARLNQGDTIPGASLAPTNPTRKWDTEGLGAEGDTEIRKLLQNTLKKLRLPSDLDVVAPRVTVSPAQAERLMGKPLFQEHLSTYAPAKPTGNYTLKLGQPKGRGKSSFGSNPVDD